VIPAEGRIGNTKELENSTPIEERVVGISSPSVIDSERSVQPVRTALAAQPEVKIAKRMLILSP
jgi:hypothetical protein